jgi:hypothetical protein
MRTQLEIIAEFLREYRESVIYETNRKNIYDISRKFIEGKETKSQQGLHQRLWTKPDNNPEFEALTGLVYSSDWQRFGVHESSTYGGPSVQILNLRLVSRVGPDGNMVNQIVFGLRQRLGVVYKNGKFDRAYGQNDWNNRPEGGFEVYGGCAFIFDLDTLKLKYVISKRLLDPNTVATPKRDLNFTWIDEQFHYLTQQFPLAISPVGRYFGASYDG